MSFSPEYKQYLIDLFEPFGDVQIRAMFGGGGVYHQGLMFGLFADETLYLKVDSSNISSFESEDMVPFIYEGKSGKPIRMSYWRVPDRLLDDPDELAVWSQKAFAVAAAGKKKKSGHKKTS